MSQSLREGNGGRGQAVVYGRKVRISFVFDGAQDGALGRSGWSAGMPERPTSRLRSEPGSLNPPVARPG